MTTIETRKTTSLEYAILGLLNNEPLSGYQLRKEFETTALGNYSSSPGAIYPALKRLRNSDLIEQISQDGSKKQKFQCTTDGRRVLKNWFLKKIVKRDISHNMAELLLRFGFMDKLTSTEQKMDFLKSLENQIDLYLEELYDYYNSPVFNKLPLNGQLAFEYGLASYKTSLLWSRKCIKTLKKNI